MYPETFRVTAKSSACLERERKFLTSKFSIADLQAGALVNRERLIIRRFRCDTVLDRHISSGSLSLFSAQSWMVNVTLISDERA